jgi:hypothetical protein
MLALQLVIGAGLALLFPMLICDLLRHRDSQAAAEIQRLSRGSCAAWDRCLRPGMAIPGRSKEAGKRGVAKRHKAQAGYAKTLFIVMTPFGVATIFGGYLLGVSAIGTGLLTG